MCGIAGIFNFDGQPVSETRIKKMADSMVHRGPDDEGVYIKENIGLGHRRLSIIDLSQRAHQPMCNEDRSVWIVYNGEIYNYRELNQDLLRKGHQIKSNCDTETIIHLWEEYGPRCVDYLRGMFAFAIWDEKQRVLFASVDRMRIKPLYFTQIGKSFVFASELKAIVASDLYDVHLNFEAIHHFLSMQAVPVPMTIYKDVFTLPGGSALEVKNNQISVYQYWDVKFEINDGGDELFYKNKIKSLITEAVQLRMMSDVPLGAFLSGGIDSSIIVGLMRDMQTDPVQTFTIGYDVGGLEWDDTRFAQLVANKYQTNHRVQIVTAKDVIDELPNFIQLLDQPSTDAINSYFVSKLAAENVTVVQCGQGGDELFAGYFTFDVIEKYFRRDQIWEKMPSLLRKTIIGAHTFALKSLQNFSLTQSFEKFIEAYGSFSNKYANIRMELDEKEKQQVYTRYFKQQVGNLKTVEIYRHYDKRFNGNGSLINKVSFFDLKTHLGDVLMRDVDAMSMAFSLETRIPLIDHKLVEFVATIPPTLKMKNGKKKYIFIEALKDLLPDEVLNREKRGFAFPLRLWLRKELKPMLEYVLSRENVERRGFFKYDEIEKLKQNYYSWKSPNYRKIWGFAILEMWMRQSIEKDDVFFNQMHQCVVKSMEHARSKQQ